MATTQPRRSSIWYRDHGMTDASRMSLVINELDEFADAIESIKADVAGTRREVRARLNWIVGLLFTILTGLVVAFAAVVR
jgi:hypothetical protein